MHYTDLTVQDSPVLDTTILDSSARYTNDRDGYTIEVDVYNKLPCVNELFSFTNLF